MFVLPQHLHKPLALKSASRCLQHQPAASLQPCKHKYITNTQHDAVSDTFPLHAHGQALLIAAVLAAVALAFVDQTLFVVPAGVAQVFAHGPFKETFTALAAVNSVVFP